MADNQNTFPHGFCQCGCGQRTNIVKKTRTNAGWIKGEPLKYIHGHQGRGKPGQRGYQCPRWKGGKRKHGSGYICVYQPCHPKAGSTGYVFEHILIAEKMLGRPLKKPDIVHHLDENKANNEEENIYVFCTPGDHIRHHKRLKAFQSCGHWDWIKCEHCQQYDHPKNIKVRDSHKFHFPCLQDYRRKQLAKKRQQVSPPQT